MLPMAETFRVTCGIGLNAVPSPVMTVLSIVAPCDPCFVSPGCGLACKSPRPRNAAALRLN
jgi:hypothetical protein